MPISYINHIDRIKHNHTYQEFLDYLYQLGSETTTKDELQELYQQSFVLTLNKRQVIIPFSPITYTKFVELMEELTNEH